MTADKRAPRTFQVQVADLGIDQLFSVIGVQSVTEMRAGLYLVVIDPLCVADAILSAIAAMAKKEESE